MKEILLKAKQVVQDDFHFSGNVTIGSRTKDIDVNMYII